MNITRIRIAFALVLGLSGLGCGSGKPPHSTDVAREPLSTATQTFDMAELVGPSDAPEVQFALDVPESYQEQIVNPGWVRYKGDRDANVPRITVSVATPEDTPQSPDEASELATSGELVEDGLDLSPDSQERIDDGYLVVTRGGGWSRVSSWLTVPGGGAVTCTIFIRDLGEESPLLDWGRKVCGSLRSA